MPRPARNPPPEFRLAAACCQWPPSERRNAAIRAAAAQTIDWERFLQVAMRQRVVGLAQHGLNSAGISLPPDIASRLLAAAAQTARQNLLRASESLRLQDLFDAAAIAVLFVKGTALARLAFDDLAVKEAHDIDILIAPGGVRAACATLRAAGYTRFMPAGEVEDERFFDWVGFAHECSFWHRAHRTIVDLHWRLSDNPAWLTKIDARAPAQAVTIFAGRALRTLSDADLFAYLCLHGALHGWSRLKWLADLAAWLSAKPPEDIERFYRAAKAAGIGRAPDQALLLCQRLLDLPLPPALAQQMPRDRIVRWLVSIAQDAMTGGGAVVQTRERPLGGVSIVLSQLLLAPSAGNWLAVLRQNAVGWTDYSRVALPRPLFFVYPLLRLPSWLWRHGGRVLGRSSNAARTRAP